MFRDWSDRVDVYVVESAIPSVYGLKTKEEVEEEARRGTLEVIKHRVNVRGVVRVDEKQVKYFVAEICEWDNQARISKTAARLALGWKQQKEKEDSSWKTRKDGRTQSSCKKRGSEPPRGPSSNKR